MSSIKRIFLFVSFIVVLLFVLLYLRAVLVNLQNFNRFLKTLEEQYKKLELRIKKIEQGKREVLATAYTSSRKECDDTPFITASNKRVRWGVIAMDKVPFGTKVYIPFFKKVFVVEDRGRAIRGSRIDIWMPNRNDAIKFGKKRLIVYVLGR